MKDGHALQRVPHPRRDGGRRRGGGHRPEEPVDARPGAAARHLPRARARALGHRPEREHRGRPRARVHRQPALEGHDATGASRRLDHGIAPLHRRARREAEPRLDGARAKRLLAAARQGRRERARRRAAAGRPRLARHRDQPVECPGPGRASPGTGRHAGGHPAQEFDHARVAARRLAAAPPVPRERPLCREVDDGQVQRPREQVPGAGGRRRAPPGNSRRAGTWAS